MKVNDLVNVIDDALIQIAKSNGETVNTLYNEFNDRKRHRLHEFGSMEVECLTGYEDWDLEYDTPVTVMTIWVK